MTVQTPLSPAPMLDVRNLVKRFGVFEALKSVSLKVAEGEVVAVIGPSGSGKSTLVRCINLLEPVHGGAMYLDNELLGYRVQNGALREMTARERAMQRRHMSMVFQQFALFPHMTAEENVMEGPVHVLGIDKAGARERARHLLARVGLGNHFDAYPSQISGGQKQRVAIARALAMRPRIMLFDEPTSALDPELVGEVLDVMSDLSQAGKTMIVVTHEIGFAREVADRVVFMAEGRIVEEGPARETLADPKSDRLRDFLSRVM